VVFGFEEMTITLTLGPLGRSGPQGGQAAGRDNKSVQAGSLKMLVYLFYRLIALVVNLVPRSVGNWLALRIADSYYFLSPAKRAAVRSNLRVILGEKASPAQLQYQLRWTFRCFGKSLAELADRRRIDARFTDRCLTFKGVEHVRAARTAGRGAVLVGAHMGNWEMVGAAASLRGAPVLAIVQPHPNPRVHRFFMSQRERLDYRVLPVGHAARPILRHLAANGLVALLGDRPYGEEGLEVEFFGRATLLPTGPARLALISGAELIPWFVVRRFDDSFTIAFEPPIPRPVSGSSRERARAMTQAFARVLETYVRENPSQWLTFYPVWDGNGRPPGDAFSPATGRHSAGQPVVTGETLEDEEARRGLAARTARPLPL
jgi:lauroyl/myristoyl acyltransferase